jgi:hypothetical protein
MVMNDWKRRTLLIGLILAIALIWLRPLDNVAERYTERGIKRAFATFAAARTLNAAISFIQEASVNVQMGVGATITPGAVLDPLDDLVEQFSEIMLLSTLSFASQRLLIEVSRAVPICVFLTILFFSWFLFCWRKRTPPTWLPKLALALLCLRLTIPTLALGSELFYQGFLSGEYETSKIQVENAQIPDDDYSGDSFTEKAKHWWSKGIDMAKKIGALSAWADNFVEHIVRLAAVFIVQTVFFPLFFLWGMLRLYRILTALVFS